MLDIKIAFCFVCGERLRVRYPDNNPENGPAELRCSKDGHPTVDEYVRNDFGLSCDIVHEYLSGFEDPDRDDEDDDTSQEIKNAGHLMLHFHKGVMKRWEEAKKYVDSCTDWVIKPAVPGSVDWEVLTIALPATLTHKQALDQFMEEGPDYQDINPGHEAWPMEKLKYIVSDGRTREFLVYKKPKDGKSTNQCDGCRAGHPRDENGFHEVPYPSGSMKCQADKYK